MATRCVGEIELASGPKAPILLFNSSSALSSLLSNVAAAVAWFFLPGLPCVLSLDLAMEVTMKVRVDLSMALHVVLRGKSVSKTTLTAERKYGASNEPRVTTSRFESSAPHPIRGPGRGWGAFLAGGFAPSMSRQAGKDQHVPHCIEGRALGLCEPRG